MKILFDKTGAPTALSQMLQQLDADESVASVLVFAADGNGWTPTGIDDILRAAAKPVFGGIFPQVLHDAEHLEIGTVIVGLPNVAQVAVVDSLSDHECDFGAAIDTAFPQAMNHGTMFILVDGFSQRISALIDAVFNSFGLSINYLGGGGGSLSLVQKPCVITPSGLQQDVAVLAYMDINSGVGVAHGWEPISTAHRVTEAKGNVVISLDWRPAFEVYREVVEPHAAQRFNADNFFSIAKAYPLGIAKLGTEVIVRDPLMLDSDKLVCVGEVPVGAFVHVLHGNHDTLIAAAKQARQGAEATFSSGQPHIELFVDCISRVLFLEKEFDLELLAARSPNLPMVGALTIGEIANNGQDYLEFYNKTSVIALI
ncbi:MAG TPA: histidine kinase [Gallionella sp.]|nr:FIST C-terminal domain-containing protein [Gallionella sp.]OGS68078.1 MAG: hypothetical protein A2Z87_12030 [Gallionellales bacterium GWA2_54_124]HCI53543.1 histidine kinase [Gallionella sp.]